MHTLYIYVCIFTRMLYYADTQTDSGKETDRSRESGTGRGTAGNSMPVTEEREERAEAGKSTPVRGEEHEEEEEEEEEDIGQAQADWEGEEAAGVGRGAVGGRGGGRTPRVTSTTPPPLSRQPTTAAAPAATTTTCLNALFIRSGVWVWGGGAGVRADATGAVTKRL